MLLDADPWPLALLVLRLAAVGLLYVFLLTAFRALRADLRASNAPERAGARASAEAWPSTREAYPREAAEAWDDDEWEQEEELPASDRGRPDRRQKTGVRVRVWLPVTAAILVAAFGGTALLLADQEPGAPPASAGSEATTADPFEPPTVAPDPGRVTVGLAATEDAQVRVTVDGVVEFEGVLRSGERQAWEAGERIQVWTDSGRTIQLAVNGVDLGPYSPAMGEPDWNRIDFGFWPGWVQ